MIKYQVTYNKTRILKGGFYGSNEEKHEEIPEENNSEIEDKASKLGYNYGKDLHTMRAGYYKEENEKRIKDIYVGLCKDYQDSNYLGAKNYNNRALYEVFREAFWKGYNDANNAL